MEHSKIKCISRGHQKKQNYLRHSSSVNIHRKRSEKSFNSLDMPSSTCAFHFQKSYGPVDSSKRSSVSNWVGFKATQALLGRSAQSENSSAIQLSTCQIVINSQSFTNLVALYHFLRNENRCLSASRVGTRNLSFQPAVRS